jgi:hypothetical protein
MGRPVGKLPSSQETLVYTLRRSATPPYEAAVSVWIRNFFRLRGLSLDKNTVSQSGSFFSRRHDGFGKPFIPGTFMSFRFFSRKGVSMFSFLRKKIFSKGSVSGLLVLVVLTALLFAACPTDPQKNEGPSFVVPNALKGMWVSSFGEQYVISGTSLINKYEDSITYAGTIVNHRNDNANAGYITIKYTEALYYPAGAGKFYVIHYKDLNSPAISISGAYSPDFSNPDPEFTDGSGGKSTQAAADAAYTVAGGYFGGYSFCYKLGSETSIPNKFEGTWNGGSQESFSITKETIVYSMAGYPVFYGVIVNVRDNYDKGYITFRYLENGLDAGLAGKYCVLYWEDYNSSNGKAGMAVASYEYIFGDEGKDTKDEAESTYTANNDDYFDVGDLDTFTKQPYRFLTN